MKSIISPKIFVLSLALWVGSVSCKTTKAPLATPTEHIVRTHVSDRDRLESTALLIDGSRQKMLGNWAQAVVLFYNATNKDPFNDAALFELAKAHAMQGQFEDALQYAKRAVEIDPNNTFYLTVLADIYTLSNQVESAVEIYRRLTTLHPQRLDFLSSLANTYIYNKQMAEALQVFNRIESIIGFSEEVSLQKQRILIDLGRTDEAIAEAEKIVALFPGESLFAEMLGELYMETGKPEKARALFEKMLETNPESPVANLMLADYFQSRGETDKAFGLLKIAFKSPELNTEGKGRILYTFYNLSQQNPLYLEQALELCLILIELHPEQAEPYLIYGDFLAREERLTEAREQFLMAAKIDPSKVEVWQQILIIDNSLEQYEAMLAHSNRALEHFFEHPILFLFNGLANLQLKNYRDAASSLEAGAVLAQNDTVLMVQFYSMLGDTYHYLNDPRRSDQSYEKALRLDPKNATVLNNFAYHLSVRKHRLPDAELMATEANRLSPGVSAYQDTLGWVYYQLGRYIEAREWIGKAVENAEKPSGTVLEHYGDVLYKLSLADEALQFWQKALEAGDASDLLPKKIKDRKLYE